MEIGCALPRRDVADESIASDEQCHWHADFTFNSGPVAARQRTDAMGHEQTLLAQGLPSLRFSGLLIRYRKVAERARWVAGSTRCIEQARSMGQLLQLHPQR